MRYPFSGIEQHKIVQTTLTSFEGDLVGTVDGPADGATDGPFDDDTEGSLLGLFEGDKLGTCVGCVMNDVE